MAKRNSVGTHRLQLSIDPTTDRILGTMVPIGLHGRNKAEVASWILRTWIWENNDKLAKLGISLSRNDEVAKS